MISFEAFRSVEGDADLFADVRFVKQGLAAGRFLDGDELPSRRLVSATLAVNPNTVQRPTGSWRRRDSFSPDPGAGSHITASPQQVKDIRQELFRSEVQETVAAMKRMGLKKEEAVALLRQLYDEEERE